MSKVLVFIHAQLVMIVSAPSLRNRNKGRRLTKKANFTAALTCRRDQVGFLGFGVRVVKTGSKRMVKISRRLDVIINDVGLIATTWICTKSFWFLRPTDELLSFRSRGE